MNSKQIGGYIGKLKNENNHLKVEVEELKFEIAMLKNQNRQLFQQVYNSEINLKGRGTVTVGRGK